MKLHECSIVAHTLINLPRFSTAFTKDIFYQRHTNVKRFLKKKIVESFSNISLRDQEQERVQESEEWLKGIDKIVLLENSNDLPMWYSSKNPVITAMRSYIYHHGPGKDGNFGQMTRVFSTLSLSEIRQQTELLNFIKKECNVLCARELKSKMSQGHGDQLGPAMQTGLYGVHWVLCFLPTV